MAIVYLHIKFKADNKMENIEHLILYEEKNIRIKQFTSSQASGQRER